jgi:hypothetical protein
LFYLFINVFLSLTLLFFLMLNNFLLVMMTSQRKMSLWFLSRLLWLLLEDALKRKLWWSNRHQSFRRKILVHRLWSIRGRLQLQLFLLRFISHPLPLTMWVLLPVIDFVISWTLRFLHNLCSAAFDAEISFSWRWMCQDSGDCWCIPRFFRCTSFFYLFLFHLLMVLMAADIFSFVIVALANHYNLYALLWALKPWSLLTLPWLSMFCACIL